MRTFLTFFVAIFFLFACAANVSAVSNPLSVENNRFGIHIIDPSDLEDAAALVNSSGGDWGYVTFVIQQTQRDTRTWQEAFNKARRLHLIPIVRIATRPTGDIWEKPSFGDIDGWVSFLSSLNWVVKNRYVVIANEPNHAKEWGGEVNPEEYGQYLFDFASKLKSLSDDFFILPAGFDASAPNANGFMDESTFLKRMFASKPELINVIDGWTSHSYPNPDFTGSENAFGKGSVRTYLWEQSFIRSLGIEKELPVFITETGWSHKLESSDKKGLDPEIIGQKYLAVFNSAWNEENVTAVTPFVLSYNEPPFDVFSWKDKDGNFYPFYHQVLALPKEKGNPIQEDSGKIISLFVQPFHFTNSSYLGVALIKNEGQAIWDKKDLSLVSQNGLEYTPTSHSFELLEPGNLAFITFKRMAPSEAGAVLNSICLTHKGSSVTKPSHFQLITITAPEVKKESLFAKILKLMGL
jgi:hypothetical protein